MPLRNKRRVRRRSTRKARLLAAVLGGLCAASALVFWALGYERRLCLFYGGVAVGCLGAWPILAWRGSSRSRRAARPADSGGAALILVLLVTALAAGLALPAGLHARLALRHARARYERSVARTAAADAVMVELREGLVVARPEESDGERRVAVEDPAGARVEMTMTGIARQTLVARGLVPRGLPPGRFVRLQASGEFGIHRSEVAAVAHRALDGEVRVIAWVER